MSLSAQRVKTGKEIPSRRNNMCTSLDMWVVGVVVGREAGEGAWRETVIAVTRECEVPR